MATDFEGYTKLSAGRVENIQRIAHTDTEIVIGLLYADWDYPVEHDQWMQRASDEEIASWVRACTR